MKTSNKLFSFKKVVAVGLSIFIAMQGNNLIFANVEDNEYDTLLEDVNSFLDTQQRNGCEIRFISSDEVPNDIVPLKVNSISELKSALGISNDKFESSDISVNSRCEGTCDYKREISAAGSKFGLLVTATYDVKNGDIPGPHLPKDWYFKSANGYMDLMGICINKKFENSSTNCDFSSDSPEMKVTSKGTLVTYISVAEQTIESRCPIMEESTFYAYNH